MSTPHILLVTILCAFSGVVFSGTAYANTPVSSLKEMREQGVVMQEWDISCGAAALATALTYGFYDPVSEEVIARSMLKNTEPLKVRHRGGFSLLDMRNFLDARGYQSYGMAGLSVDDILYMNKPIIPIQVQGFKHFVVFNGLTDKGEIELADPAWGIRTLQRDDFDKVWLSGIGLIIKGEK